MGDIFRGIFGGSKQKSTSSSVNQAYPFIQDTFGGLTGAASEGLGGLRALLGGDASGFNAYKDATGFDRLLEQGSRGITGNAAASGLLRSGGTAKAISDYAGTMQNKYANDYLNNLLKLAQGGFDAGSLITNAGSTSASSSSGNSTKGIAGFLGGLLG